MSGLRLRLLRGRLPPAGGVTHAFAPEFETTYAPRDGDRPTLVQVSGGVIAAPGQNGHIEVYVGAGDPPETLVGALALRYERSGTELAARVASGGQLTALVPAGQRYRLARKTIEGYAEPEFVLTTFVTETTL